MQKRPRSATTKSQPTARRRKVQAMTPYRLPYQQRRTAPLGLSGRPSSQEVKSFDSSVAGGALPAIGAAVGAEPGVAFAGFTELNCIPQGATVANRIGNKVVCKSLHIKGTIYNNNTALLAVARLMVVYDKQPNGAFPAMADILVEQPAGAPLFYGSLNIANKSRFQVIRDGFYNLDSAQSNIHTFNLYCKGRWETEFGANAGTIGDFRTGAIYLIGIYANAIVLLSNVACRVRYYD